MALSDTEFDTILSDPSKRIQGAIAWAEDEDHSPCVDFKRIRTPFLYPDGDSIDLFYKVEGDVITVSDLAETSRWLRMQTVSPRHSAEQLHLVEDIRLTHGVEYYRGMLQARCHLGESLDAVVTRVAQSALRMAEIRDLVADVDTEDELPDKE
ncbi:MAG: hypothetical protein CVV51_02435 [Spirochaetae bacterium HGW-Spirochaetae-7]|jgi:hypothetical protein|nr:MAG: hypothetical protein CVV51_02435 [Spirochaetae bacterium HGW-Spirochaetae-7]